MSIVRFSSTIHSLFSAIHCTRQITMADAIEISYPLYQNSAKEEIFAVSFKSINSRLALLINRVEACKTNSRSIITLCTLLSEPNYFPKTFTREQKIKRFELACRTHKAIESRLTYNHNEPKSKSKFRSSPKPSLVPPDLSAAVSYTHLTLPTKRIV